MRCDLECPMLYSVTDFSKTKQSQPPLTHVAKPKGTLQSASTASHVLKYKKNCNSEVFWELCMCCQHDEHSHNICVTTTTKNRSKTCFRGFKVCSDYGHTAKGEYRLPSDVLVRISKKTIEDPKHQET